MCGRFIVSIASYSNGNCFKSNLNVWWIEITKSINWKRKKLSNVVFCSISKFIRSFFRDALASPFFDTFAINQQLFSAFELRVCLIFSYDRVSALNSVNLNSKNRTLFIYSLIAIERERKKRLAGFIDEMIFDRINIETELFSWNLCKKTQKSVNFFVLEIDFTT